MPEAKKPFNLDFLRNKPAKIVTIVLVAQIILFYALPTKEVVPNPPPLDQFTTTVGPWNMTQQFTIDQETHDLLRADDMVQRDYQGPDGQEELFVAFFRSQRAGVTPHSPKLCLPTNGWAEESAGMVSITVPGESAPIPVNRYVVTKDEVHELVLYWYQNKHRVTANEYLSRLYLVYDSLRYRRSDEALVRVTAELHGDKSEWAGQEQSAIKFIQDVYQPLRRQMWSGPTASAALLP